MQSNSAVKVFAALGQETRLEALQLLAGAGEAGLAAGEIARRLNIAQATLSDHLAVLSRAGVVTSERRSRSIIYRANSPILKDLQEFLKLVSDDMN